MSRSSRLMSRIKSLRRSKEKSGGEREKVVVPLYDGDDFLGREREERSDYEFLAGGCAGDYGAVW